MTKYVVNSGNVRGNTKKAKKFFSEVVKDLGDYPKILICFFASGREYWEEKFQADLDELLPLFPQNVKPSFFLAMPDTFEKQIEESDSVYIHGGDDELLLYWMRKFNIPKIWEGKVIATSSASSHMLSKHFWTCDWRQCKDGLGILPMRFLAHFKSEYGVNDSRGPIDWDKAYKELASYGDPTLPIYALEEGDFKVFEK